MMVMKYKKKCCENVSTGGNTGQGDVEMLNLLTWHKGEISLNIADIYVTHRKGLYE